MWVFTIHPMSGAQFVLLQPNSKIFLFSCMFLSPEKGGENKQSKTQLIRTKQGKSLRGAEGAFARLRGLLKIVPARAFRGMF